MASGDAVVVVARQSLRDGVAADLDRMGVEFQGAVDSGRYVSLDAAETLSTFMVAGRPDPVRFNSFVGRVIADAAHRGGEVRVFGEMVALLWDEGSVSGAVELESLWNQLAREHRFSLRCAYPMGSVAANGDLGRMGEVCSHHSSFATPARYRSSAPSPFTPDGPAERSELFVPVPLAVRAARQFVTATLEAWHYDDLAEPAAIVVSELATNALLYSRSAFQVSVRDVRTSVPEGDAGSPGAERGSHGDVRTSVPEGDAGYPGAERGSHGDVGRTVRISVRDLTAEPPERRDRAAEADFGRGVALVADLAVNWGTEARPDGKVVWAELARPAG